MSENDFDPVLVKASDEIREILRKNDIAGVVHLFSATHGEFLNHITEPTWSGLEMVETGIKVKLMAKSGGESERLKAEATVHMVHSVRDMAGVTFQIADRLVKFLHQHMDIEFSGKRKFSPRED